MKKNAGLLFFFFFIAAVICSVTFEKNDIGVVTENLRLRTEGSLKGSVVATLQVGTKVTITAVGKEETIDRIQSNWVEVKTGNMSGWCFGGYLAKPLSGDEIIAALHAGKRFSNGDYVINVYDWEYPLYCTTSLIELEMRDDRETAVTIKDDLIFFDGWLEENSPYRLFFEPSFDSLYALKSVNQNDVFKSNPPESGTSIKFDGISCLIINKSYKVVKVEQWYIKPDEASRTVFIRKAFDGTTFDTAQEGYKIKKANKILPGEVLTVYAQTSDKYPYQGKEGYWYLITVSDLGDYKGQPVWVFEDGLEETELYASWDYPLLMKSMRENGGIPFSEKEWKRINNTHPAELMSNVYKEFEW